MGLRLKEDDLERQIVLLRKQFKIRKGKDLGYLKENGEYQIVCGNKEGYTIMYVGTLREVLSFLCGMEEFLI